VAGLSEGPAWRDLVLRNRGGKKSGQDVWIRLSDEIPDGGFQEVTARDAKSSWNYCLTDFWASGHCKAVHGEKVRKSEAGESRRARSGREPLRFGGRLHRFPFHLGDPQSWV